MAIKIFQSSFYSTFWSNYSSESSNRGYAFAEAVISPGKYALFQILGGNFIQATGQLNTPSCISSASSAKVGAFGGTALGLFYISLLFQKNHRPHDDVPNFGSLAFSMLCKEMAYSAVASIIGAYASGVYNRRELIFLAICGFLGPVLFLAILFGMLGLVIAVAWNIERLKDWWTGH